MKKAKKTDYKRLLELASSEKRLLGWGSVFLLVGSFASLLYPQAVKWIIDEAIIPKDLHRLNQVALVLFLATLLQGVATAIRSWLFTFAGERIVLRLREKLFSRLLKQEVSFFDSTPTGDLMSRLSADTAVIQSAVGVNLSMLARNLAQAIGGSALLFYTSAKLSFFALALVPPIGFGVIFIGKRLRKLSKTSREQLANAASNAEEAISGVRTVRSFIRESFEVIRYEKSLSLFLGLVRRRITLIAGFTMVITVLAAFGLGGMIWLGGRLVIEGDLTVGDLTSYVMYLLIVSIAIGTLGSLWMDFVSAFGAADRVFELMDRSPAIEEDGGQPIQIKNAKIEFKNVSFSYPSRPQILVTKNLSFEISPGEIIALVGPSGAGKSTITSLLLRYYDPTEGKILIDEQNIKEVSVDSLRELIGVVSQDVFLMSASIEENIRYGKLAASHTEIMAASKASFVDEFASQLPDKYSTLVGERGIQLSGGQKQRVAIARALLKDPKILILDEATSSLDAEGEFQIREALKTLMKGRTTLIIAHRLSTVRMASRVIVMEQGKIIQSGTHDELIADKENLYSRLIERQIFLDHQ